MLKKFIHSKEEEFVFLRTLVEGVIGWLVANIGDIFNLFSMDDKAKTMVMGIVVVLLTEILSYMRSKEGENVEQ